MASFSVKGATLTQRPKAGERATPAAHPVLHLRCLVARYRTRYNGEHVTANTTTLMSDMPDTANPLPAAPLWRRLTAMLYDSLLCIALLFVVTAVYTGLHELLINAGLFSDRYTKGDVSYNPLLMLILIASMWLFFGFFWRRAGQTLGMQTWRIRVENRDGSRISWLQSLLRVIAGGLSCATFGLGWVWQWLDPQHRSWTDHLSRSRTVQLPERKRETQ